MGILKAHIAGKWKRLHNAWQSTNCMQWKNSQCGYCQPKPSEPFGTREGTHPWAVEGRDTLGMLEESRHRNTLDFSQREGPYRGILPSSARRWQD